jgi:putative Mg2+ transporter-C (MgtC) family protein
VSSLELIFPTGILAQLEIALRLLLAIALAALLGWDREEKNRPAGLRTYMLVALAAAVFTVLTFEIYETVQASQTSANADPIRIIEAVTAGVAFLAAGAIIQGRNNTVQGLTTGAGMWMAGALGVAAGAGHYLLAILGAMFAFSILKLVYVLQARADENSSRTLIIESAEDEGSG